MRVRDHLSAFTKLGVGAFQVCECAARKCDKNFAAIDGFAFAGRSPSNDQVRLYLFCDSRCYLEALPPEACWHA